MPPISMTFSQRLIHGIRSLLLMGLILICWLGLTLGSGAQAAELPLELQTLDRQLQELQPLIQKPDLPEISPYVRSRFRLLRKQLLLLSQELPQPEQKQASQISRRIAQQLVEIDQGARREQISEVREGYQGLLQAVDEFEDLYR